MLPGQLSAHRIDKRKDIMVNSVQCFRPCRLSNAALQNAEVDVAITGMTDRSRQRTVFLTNSRHQSHRLGEFLDRNDNIFTAVDQIFESHRFRHGLAGPPDLVGVWHQHHQCAIIHCQFIQLHSDVIKFLFRIGFDLDDQIVTVFIIRQFFLGEPLHALNGHIVHEFQASRCDSRFRDDADKRNCRIRVGKNGQ